MRRAAVIIGMAALAVAAGVVYFVFDPSRDVFFPRCIFLSITGWQCPGCGSQRALHALLHGDVASAWRYNAALLLALPVVGAYALGELKRTAWPRYYRAIGRPAVVWTLLLALVAWWVLRNVL